MGAGRTRESPPGWLAVLVGWLAGTATVSGIERQRAGGAAPPAGAPVVAVALERMSPRELRGLPGLGQVRAIEYARARWRRDASLGPLAPEDVPGIGPRTARRIAEALAEER